VFPADVNVQPMRATLLVIFGALGLVAADKTKTVWCKNEGGNCNYPNITLTSDTYVYCVENQPLLSWQTCTGSMLQLFDVQKLHVTSTCTSTEIRIASDDTWLVDLIRFNNPASIEQRAIDALNKDKPFLSILKAQRIIQEEKNSDNILNTKPSLVFK
jgi:hypothetical protein